MIGCSGLDKTNFHLSNGEKMVVLFGISDAAEDGVKQELVQKLLYVPFVIGDINILTWLVRLPKMYVT